MAKAHSFCQSQYSNTFDEPKDVFGFWMDDVALNEKHGNRTRQHLFNPGCCYRFKVFYYVDSCPIGHDLTCQVKSLFEDDHLLAMEILQLDRAFATKPYFNHRMLRFLAELTDDLPNECPVMFQVKPIGRMASTGLEILFNVGVESLHQLLLAKGTWAIGYTELFEDDVEQIYLIKREPAFSQCQDVLKEVSGFDAPEIVAGYGGYQKSDVIEIGHERFNPNLVFLSKVAPENSDSLVCKRFAQKLRGYKVTLRLTPQDFDRVRSLKQFLFSRHLQILPIE